MLAWQSSWPDLLACLPDVFLITATLLRGAHHAQCVYAKQKAAASFSTNTKSDYLRLKIICLWLTILNVKNAANVMLLTRASRKGSSFLHGLFNHVNRPLARITQIKWTFQEAEVALFCVHMCVCSCARHDVAEAEGLLFCAPVCSIVPCMRR